MLAQNFKTPADLGIDGLQFEALVKVLGMLERGEIRHQSKPRETFPIDASAPTRFNLSSWRCGTAACIGGWAEFVGHVKFRGVYGSRTGLDRLFFPDNYPDEIGMNYRKMCSVTPRNPV